MYSKKKTYKGKGTRRLNKTRRSVKNKKMGGSKRRTHHRKGQHKRMHSRAGSRRKVVLSKGILKHGGSANLSPLIGSPYNAGEAEPQGNYYAYNRRVEPWPATTNMIGGKNKGKGKKNLRGGGFSEFVSSVLPLEMVNIGRSIPAGLGHMYDRFNGSLSSPSSMVFPTQQPLASVVSGSDTTNRMMTPPDLTKMYIENNNAVSRI
jgi:hypothetical protein